ncbi:MAG TPA: TRAP transporter fused permease subunit [Burkholderiales bacterium]|nr:TRAP transporter fused permease subunit [Burkholderiales bacterium]
MKSPVAGALRTALATALTLASVAWALDLPLWLRLDLYPAQFYAAMLGLALPLAFLALPAGGRGRREDVPWYDALAALAGFAAVAYLTWQYQALVDLILLRPRGGVIAGAVAIVLTLEALRRSTGRTLPVICAVFIAYAMWGDVLPGPLAARATDWQKLSAYLALDVNGMLGLPLAVACTIVIAFLLFGELLNASRGARFFTDIAMLSMGRYRGGPAKMAVVGSALFGSVSGSAVANVVATGVITIPLIKKSGYPAHKAAAIEAVASTGGQLMPPIMGASAFLMAEFLQIPYAEVVLAALLPAILYYVALFIQADLDAARLGIAPLERAALPPSRVVLPGLYYLLPFAALIVALFGLNQTPQLSALAGTVLLVPLALAFGYRGERPRWREFLRAVPAAGHAVLDIVLVCTAAGIVIGVLGISGLGYNLTQALVQVGQGSLGLLLVLTAVVCIVLGMGLPTVGVYVLLAALVAPALVKVGVMPIAAHLYVMYFGMMSMITPPVAIAAFAAASLAGADPMRTGWSAVTFGWTAFVVPFLFVLSPQLLLQGAPWAVALAAATAMAGVWLGAIAITGYFLRSLAMPWRVAFGASGLLALIPAGAFPGAVLTDVAGMLAGLALIGHEIMAARRGTAPPAR